MSTSTVTVAGPNWQVSVGEPSASSLAATIPPLDTYQATYTDAYVAGFVPA